MVRGGCDRDYGFPSYPACSGNGVCVSETSKCLCDKGWSSLADFQLADGVDCDVHLPTVFSMASITLAASCFGTIVCMIALYSVGLRQTNKSYNKQIKITLFLLALIGLVVSSSLRIINTETHVIGMSLWVSIGVFVNLYCTSLGYSYVIDEVVIFLHKSFRFIDQQSSSKAALNLKLAFFRKYSIVPPCFAFTTVTFLVAVQADPAACDYFAVGFMATLVFLLCIYGLFIMHTIPIFIDEMTKLVAARPTAPETAKIKGMLPKLSIVHAIIKIFILSVLPLFVIFMAWKFMRRKFTYLLMISLMCGSICTCVLTLSFLSGNAPRINPSAVSASNLVGPASRVILGFSAR